MRTHPLLPGAAQVLGRSILDVNPPWNVPWGMAMEPYHFKDLLITSFLYLQATALTIAWMDGQY